MIKNLHGTRETVSFADGSSIMLHDNKTCENYPNHWHTPIEIIMPLEQGYKAICGGISFQLEVGDVLIIAPGTLHSLFAPESGRRVILQADLSVLNQIKEFSSIISFITPAVCITPQKFPKLHGNVSKIMHQIIEEYYGASALNEALIYSYLIRMIVLIGRQYTEPARHLAARSIKRPDYARIFLNVCNHINQHFDENLTLDEAAAMAGFSKYHFTRLFRQFTGVTFYKYLNRRRIMHAEQLLASPEFTVTEVATRSGFSSLSAFIRMFRLLKNCTPTEFRTLYHTDYGPSEHKTQ